MTVERSNVPDAAAVREQLERILASSHFAAAPGASRLLRFLVEESLAGRAQQLKEYTLARQVFERDASFDSKTDPAVRVEASRLRNRLEHYYLTVGRADPVLIELPRGSYVPAFLPHADVLHLSEALAEAKSGREGAAVVGSLGAWPDQGPAIAVMPFENLGDASDMTFADGLSIEIVTALSRFRELHVLGHSTVFRHRGERDARRLRGELGVDWVLAGSVRRAAKQLRVNVELVNGIDGSVLWAERYERDLEVEAIFAVQEDIARDVVATLAQPQGVLARPLTVAAKRKPRERLSSYDCVLLFYDYGANHSPEAHLRVRDALEAEVREAPDVAALWSALSMVHADTWRFGYNVQQTREKALEQALRAARKAVKLDPLDALSYHALFLAHYARGDLKAFRKAGNRALELNPNHVDILADYGLHLTFCDDWDLGRLLLKAALSLNPEPPDWYWFPFFIWHFEHNEFDAALDMALRARNDRFFWTHGMHALAFAALGMRAEAAAAFSRLLETYPGFASVAREELSRWGSPERTERVLGLLRDVGLPIPITESTTATPHPAPREG
jgi:adenylate cyclase